ncbi:hypothetical protein FJZ19_05050 [Candidatus Pacearchaeota archaeon]|nr:hypothetical protein [Candidatus Pacearchaeota archaeon]
MKRSLIILCTIIILIVTVYFLTIRNSNSTYYTYEFQGKKYSFIPLNDLLPAMNYIKENISSNAVITSWWDYGHMIQAFGERKVVIFAPSKEIIENSGSVNKQYWANYKGKLSNNQDIINVARILATTDSNESKEIMKKYNSNYILVTKWDEGQSLYYNLTGINGKMINYHKRGIGVEYPSTEYCNFIGDDPAIDTCESIYGNENSTIYKIIKLKSVQGFEKIYSDSVSVIYKISS